MKESPYFYMRYIALYLGYRHKCCYYLYYHVQSISLLNIFSRFYTYFFLVEYISFPISVKGVQIIYTWLNNTFPFIPDSEKICTFPKEKNSCEKETFDFVVNYNEYVLASSENFLSIYIFVEMIDKTLNFVVQKIS